MTEPLFANHSGRSRLPGNPDAPLIVAIHGGTYTSAYFDVPGYSLLDRAAARGLPILAPDRFGYGTTPLLPQAQMTLAGQAQALVPGLRDAWSRYGAGRPGMVLIAHSIGAGIACHIAGQPEDLPLLGLAISGVGMRTPEGHQEMWESLPDIPLVSLPDEGKDHFMFGPPGSFDDDMPSASHCANTTAPKAELVDIVSTWHLHAQETLGRIAVPVHYRQAEFDNLWVVDEGEVDAFRAALTASPRADAALVKGTGHCIDFHFAGAKLQEEQLDFAVALSR